VHLKKIKYDNFRNLDNMILEPSSRVTLLSGANAQGKTNMLEAIHICCTGRSHRTSRDKELIKFGSISSFIDATCMQKDGTHRIEIRLSNTNKKAVRINNSPARRLGQLMGHMNAVMFAPEDLQLIKSGPSFRRRFVDIALSQMSSTYFYNLQRYQKALEQRNALLKNPISDKRTLDIWDEQLAKHGAFLSIRRAKFVEQLDKICSKIHSELTGEKERLKVKYQASFYLDNEDEMEKKLIEHFKKNRENDIRRVTTTTGPHRDDIEMSVNDIDVRAFGSQGQQRTCALSMKLAEVDIMHQMTGEYPLLLLDDVFSELDNSRRTWLLNYIGNVQTFITCVDIDRNLLFKRSDIDILNIKDGKLHKI
jgi:DNA replication and repair protein RecF